MTFSDQPRWGNFKSQKFAAAIGKRASLVCSVRAYPAVNFTWTVAGQGLSRTVDDDYSSVYVVDAVEEGDYGVYSCHVVNTVGTNQFDLSLQVPG